MKITIDELHTFITVSLKGEADIWKIRELKDTLLPLIEKKKDIYLNLKELDYLDSTTIGVFLQMLKLQKENDKKFILTNINDKISQVLKLSSLYHFFNIEVIP